MARRKVPSCRQQKTESALQPDWFSRIALVGIGTLIITTPLLFLPITSEVTQIKTTLSQLGIFTLLGIWGFKSIKKGDFSFRSLALDWVNRCILIFLLLQFISLLLSSYKYASVEEALRYASYFGLYFLVTWFVRTERHVRILLDVLVTTTFLACGYALVQRLGYDFMWWDSQTRVFSTFGHPEFFAGYLGIVLFVLLASFLIAHSTSKRLLLACTTILVLLCLLFTRTHGAWISVAFSMLIFGMLLGIFGRDTLAKQKVWVTLLMIVVILTAVGVVFLQPEILQGINDSAGQQKNTPQTVPSKKINLPSDVWDRTLEAVKSNFDKRLVFWRGAFEMWKTRPILGWGIGTFRLNFPRYRPTDYVRKGIPHNVLHARSEYLEVAAEMGGLGLIAFLALLFCFFRHSVGALRLPSSTPYRALIIGLLCGVIASLTHNLMSVNLRWTSPAFTFWFTFSLTIAVVNLAKGREGNSNIAYSEDNKTGRNIPTRSAYLKNKLKAVCLSLTLLGLVFMITLDLFSGVYLRRSIIASAQHHWQKAASNALRACTFDPYNLAAYYLLGDSYVSLGYTTKAITVYQRLRELSSDFAPIHYNLAKLYARTKQTYKAIESCHKALALSDSAPNHALLGELYLTQRQWWAKADVEFRHALKLVPTLLPARIGLAELYLKREESEKAEEIYQRVLQDHPSNLVAIFGLGKVYEAQKRFKAAKEQYEYVSEKQPQSKLAQSAKRHISAIQLGISVGMTVIDDGSPSVEELFRMTQENEESR